jgi:F0F1-type ATP synthase assembly protein I
MKLLRTNVRVNPRDSLGQGLDAAIILVIFFGAGFFLDRSLGTTPWMMIVLTLLGAVGLFYKLRAAYEARMVQLEIERADRAAQAPGTRPR